MNSSSIQRSQKSSKRLALQLLRQKLRAEQSRNLRLFARAVKDGYQDARHAQALCYHLQKFADGDPLYQKFQIRMPPRYGKSMHSSEILPAYLHGRYPKDKVITVTHTASLANELCGNVQKLIETPAYGEIFPNTRIGDEERQADRFRIVDRKGRSTGGRYQSFGVNESMFGAGFIWGIFDDMYPGQEAAFSAAYRRKVEDMYYNTFLSRAESDQARILMVTTRTHRDDLPAVTAERDGDWLILNLPAVCVDPNAFGEYRELDQALWESRFSREYLRQLEQQDPFAFATIQQQNPKRRTVGTMFKEEDFEERLSEIPEVTLWIRFWDIASGESDSADYTVGALVGRIKSGVHKGKLCIADIHRGRWSPSKRNEQMIAVAEKDRQLSLSSKTDLKTYFEKGFGIGTDMTNSITKALEKYGAKGVRLKGSKGWRADPFSAQCGQKNVLLVEGEWNSVFVDELCEFDPIGNTHIHDDQVDAPVGAHIMLIRHNQ